MAFEIRSELHIHARPEKVWTILTDFENYPKWNPFIKSLLGEVKIGNRIIARIEPPKASGMTFKPIVLTRVENKEFSWLGHLWFTGLFDGEHKFELIEQGDGTTILIQSEKFSGILVPLFKSQLKNNTKQGFEEMNLKIKELAERND